MDSLRDIEKDSKSYSDSLFDPHKQLPVEHGTNIVCGVAAVHKGGVKVHPQPTSDPLDPLNWSRLQKHVILSIVMLKYVGKLESILDLPQLTVITKDTSCLHTSQQRLFHPSRKFKTSFKLATPKSTGLSPYPH